MRRKTLVVLCVLMLYGFASMRPTRDASEDKLVVSQGNQVKTLQ